MGPNWPDVPLHFHSTFPDCSHFHRKNIRTSEPWCTLHIVHHFPFRFYLKCSISISKLCPRAPSGAVWVESTFTQITFNLHVLHRNFTIPYIFHTKSLRSFPSIFFRHNIESRGSIALRHFSRATHPFLYAHYTIPLSFTIKYFCVLGSHSFFIFPVEISHSSIVSHPCNPKQKCNTKNSVIFA